MENLMNAGKDNSCEIFRELQFPVEPRPPRFTKTQTYSKHLGGGASMTLRRFRDF